MDNKIPSKEEINKSFKYLLISRILRSIALSFATLAVPIYLIFIFNQNLFSVGIIYLIILGFNSFFSLFTGVISDKIGYKNGLLFSELFPLIGMFGFILSTFIPINITLFIFFAMLTGISGVGGIRGAFSAPQMALIANNWKKNNERIKRLGIIISIGSVAAIIGSFIIILQGLLSSFLLSNGVVSQAQATLLSFRYFFILTDLMIIISFFSIIFIKEAKHNKTKNKFLKKQSSPHVLKVMASQIFSGLGVGLTFPILPVLIVEAYSLNAAQSSQVIGYIFGLGYVSTALASFYISRKILKLKINTVFYASMTRVLQGILVLLIGITLVFTGNQTFNFIGIFLILIFIVSYNALLGLGGPIRQTSNVSGVAKGDYGAAVGMMSLSAQLPQASVGLSGALSSIIASFISLPLFFGGFLISISGAVYWKLLKDSKNSKTIKNSKISNKQ